MINIYLVITYTIITIALFAVAIFSKYRWIPILLGIVMGAITVMAFILEEIKVKNYWNWSTIAFFISMAAAFGLGLFFIFNLSQRWAGIIVAIGLGATVAFTLIDVIMYGIFPLLPGANVSIISLISLLSMLSIGIITGKSVADRKNDRCIPFLEKCSNYECDNLAKCDKK